MTDADKLSGEDVLACEVSVEWYPGRATAPHYVKIDLLDATGGYIRHTGYLIPRGRIPETMRNKMAALDIAQRGSHVDSLGCVLEYTGLLDDEYPGRGTEQLIEYNIDVTTLTEAQALADALNTYGEKQ